MKSGFFYLLEFRTFKDSIVFQETEGIHKNNIIEDTEIASRKS